MWVEARLNPEAMPRDLYDWVADDPPKRVHHFWDEPWWPGAYVVRLRGVQQANLEDCPAVSHLALWDERPDREIYADFAGWAFQFFEAGSMLSVKNSEWERRKFVHCYLNAQGLSVRQEFWFALGFAWGRLTLRPRLWWRRKRGR